jgi:N-6 DNA Methylase
MKLIKPLSPHTLMSTTPTSAQLETNLTKLTFETIDHEWIYQFLQCFGFLNSTISRLRIDHNRPSNKDTNIVAVKKKLYFKIIESDDLLAEVENLKNLPAIKGKFRHIVALNQTQMAVLDTKTTELKLIELQNLKTEHSIFLPLIGIESGSSDMEHYLDNKAAYRLGKFYEEIKVINEITTDEQIHALNQFLARILFCLFAEDTNIFPQDSFSFLIKTTQDDGSDLQQVLGRLFTLLNTKREVRGVLPEYLSCFDYVNGGLFGEDTAIPKFNTLARKFLVDSAELPWAGINPDIFGSMVQTVLRNDLKNDNTEHFTSVPNIMRVIKPLFLDELQNQFDSIITKKTDLSGTEIETKNATKKINIELDQLRDRICNIKFFDPAVGSANFLIITYKEIRRLEMAIIKEMGILQFSKVSLCNFYGIEINDFSAEIAKLSLWLAEHQMNVEFYNRFGDSNPTLPLRDSANITKGNAAQIDWEVACPKLEGDEIYIIGNPPFSGSRNQTTEQKNDLKKVFVSDSGKLDYVCIWYYLGAKYIKGANAKLALVSTNSVCQGEQVPLLWPKVLCDDIEINFAYQSFKWINSARGNAGVTCVIIGLANKNTEMKKIITNGEIAKTYKVPEINPYLMNGKTVYVNAKYSSISNLPEMVYGNYTGGCNDLFLDPNEKNTLVSKYPQLQKYIRRFVGSQEFIRCMERYCLWFKNEDLEVIKGIPEIQKKFENIRKNRLNSKDEGLRKLAQRPHQFRDLNETINSSIVIPIVSSERREYIPCGFVNKDSIIPNSAQAIYDAEPWIFGIISSRMHMVWVRAVGGRLKTDLRYSSTLIYNTFPFPEISDEYRSKITQCVFRIIAEREEFSERTLAMLYDPAKMPAGLRTAHRSLDEVIDRCYLDNLKEFRGRSGFESDGERLEMLFGLYEVMSKEAESKGKNKK